MTQDNGAGPPKGTRRKARRGAGYPKRTPFFFHRFVRLLIKSCAAMVIGADGCWLLAIIAATEDSARYRHAVRFFNQQLAQLCGWSIDKLDRVRQRCIDAGYLHYEHGGNRTPGLYWVLVDDSVDDVPDLGPIGELDSDFKPQSAEHPAEDSATEPRETCGETPEESAELTYLSFPDTSPPPPPIAMEVEPSKPEPAGDAAQLVEMKERLISSGVGDWRGLLDGFRGTGCSTEHGLALHEFWEKHRDRFDSPVGALHHRLKNAHPSIPIDEGWPGLKPTVKPKSVSLEIEVAKWNCPWGLLRKDRRHQIANQAGVELGAFDDRALDQLPPELKKPILALLARQPQLAT